MARGGDSLAASRLAAQPIFSSSCRANWCSILNAPLTGHALSLFLALVFRSHPQAVESRLSPAQYWGEFLEGTLSRIFNCAVATIFRLPACYLRA